MLANLETAPRCRVGATRHGLNLFVILVGESSKARKGTSWRQISSLFDEAAPLWSSRCVTTTRPTPNTILQALRDQQPVTDRRLFLLSEEFASVIHVLGREAGQLSPLLRRAWDGGDLCSHDGHRYVEASSAHISLVAHVTQSELAHHLSRIEVRITLSSRACDLPGQVKRGMNWETSGPFDTRVLSFGNGPFPFNHPLLFVIPSEAEESAVRLDPSPIPTATLPPISHRAYFSPTPLFLSPDSF